MAKRRGSKVRRDNREGNFERETHFAPHKGQQRQQNEKQSYLLDPKNKLFNLVHTNLT